MKYEWEAGGYEKVSAPPRAPGLSDSAPVMAPRFKVKRIGSSSQAWQTATLAIGSARFRRKPAPGLQWVASRPTARRGYTLQSAAAQRFSNMTQAVREESMSTLV